MSCEVLNFSIQAGVRPLPRPTVGEALLAPLGTDQPLCSLARAPAYALAGSACGVHMQPLPAGPLISVRIMPHSRVKIKGQPVTTERGGGR